MFCSTPYENNFHFVKSLLKLVYDVQASLLHLKFWTKLNNFFDLDGCASHPFSVVQVAGFLNHGLCTGNYAYYAICQTFVLSCTFDTKMWRVWWHEYYWNGSTVTKIYLSNGNYACFIRGCNLTFSDGCID